ncbi:MAG: hypothetical protein ACP5PS_07980, partial [Bacteroidales bacterium]
MHRFWKVFLPGFLSGAIIQLNWAQEMLLQHGLLTCLQTHWLRIATSGIVAGLLFFSVEYFLGFRKNLKSLDIHSLRKFLSCFYLLLFYLFFSPSDRLIYILTLLVPILFVVQDYFNKFIKEEGFRNIIHIYLLVLIYLFFKEILIITYSGVTNNYLYYTSLLSAPLLWLIIPILFPQLTKLYAITLGLIYFIPAFIVNSHIILYKADMPPSTYYAIWETTINESTDFIKAYVSVTIVGINTLLLAGVIILIAGIKKPFFKIALIDRLVLVSLLLLFNFMGNTFQHNIPCKFVKSYQEFRSELSKFRDSFFFRKNNPLAQQALIQCSDSSLTFILIIGESASKYHQ